MICGSKTRTGSLCQKPPLEGKKRCRLHGGMSLSGKAHPNYRHGNCSIESRSENSEASAYIKQLKQLAILLGMFEATP
jgi:hypothetical protein